MGSIKKHKWGIISSLIVAAALFYGGFQLGAVQSPPAAQEPQVEVSSDGPLGVSSTLLWDAIDIVKNKYIHIDDVKDEDFLYGTIRGAVNALGDPYTTFLNPSDAKKFDEDIRGNFGGIGAEIGKRDGQLIVVSPLKDNPAERVGLKAGDIIVKVDDTLMADFTVEEAVKIIRGEEGTVVTLLIMREEWNEAKEFEITRATVIIPTLEWEMIASPGQEDKNIVYIQLYTFNANASSLFRDAVTEALFSGTKGVILDLRNNSGGFLDVAINLAGWFIDKGDTVTEERFRSGESRALVARGNAALRNLPVVVLVNGGSASASEILAGALRDLRGAKLVGEKTFGKGSVQELETLKDGSTLKISTAEWLTPAGHSIDKEGLEPDIEVALEEPAEGEEFEDAQLKKAIEVITPMLGQAAPPPLVIEYVDLRSATSSE
tara:strand:+ start:7745 stop:9043 length:1299 start_codon:yes stop_codon:yes gene_type:complete